MNLVWYIGVAGFHIVSIPLLLEVWANGPSGLAYSGVISYIAVLVIVAFCNLVMIGSVNKLALAARHNRAVLFLAVDILPIILGILLGVFWMI